ncbi:hypothetical protein QVD17_18386 [Tagetes erecta]|uniref:Protein kinase domain-containing protein n=1 Tax=Tagetes erecta TaxID=13708 RepID=A0AAD8NW09_TARER|nr:hypothetical protein QVD17_18386 [Tagetes erecta]
MLVVDLNRSQDEISLATFALNKIQRCEVDQLIDPILGSDMNPEIKNMITSVAELAFRCLQYESEMRPTMNEALDVLMDIQALGGIKGYDSSRDFKSINLMPLSEENDSAVLLKDFPPSPVPSMEPVPYPGKQNREPIDPGNGGFGAVYYGKLQDGREVAVKKLHEHNYKRVQQFFNEVEILTKLRHPNLVVLYGFTCRQSHELLLVYEYVPNGTVEDHLHGKQANPTLLTWNIRLNIAIETARALAYLHASEIIHRDVKTNNILLDHNFFVKVADFGLSRLISNNVSHTSTAPQGTPGYVDPQYHQRYQLTNKSDVYSFGVVLIELISSLVVVDLNRSQDEISLANFALKRIQRCEIDQLIDPNLGSDTNPKIKNMITSVAELAFQCLQYESEMRPTMHEVLDVLMDIQEVGGIEAYGGTKDFETMNVLPLLETSDAVVLFKDFMSSPVSVTSDWHTNKSASTTLSHDIESRSFHSR